MSDFELTVYLQQFDDAWQHRRTAQIESMLSAPDLDTESLVELVMIDMEYRWRCASEAATLAHAEKIWMLEDYARELPQIGSISEFPIVLIAEEFRVRHRWGDEPSCDEYVQRFGETTELKASLERVLSEMKYVSVQVIAEGIKQYEMRFARSIQLGRQAVDEPEPFCVYERDGEKKLIISPLAKLSLSRQQLVVGFDGKSRIKIDNVSKDVPVRLQPGGRLECGRSVTVPLPVVVSVPDVQLCFAIE